MILALDPAYRITGYSIFDGDKLIEYGYIFPQKKGTTFTETFINLREIIRDLNNIVTRYNREGIEIDKIYAERMSGSRSQRAAMLLGSVDSMIIALAEIRKMELIMLPERTVKHTIFGRHNVSKKEVVEYVAETYPAILEEKISYMNHIADSIIVYWAIDKILKEEDNEALSKLYIQRPQEDSIRR